MELAQGQGQEAAKEDGSPTDDQESGSKPKPPGHRYRDYDHPTEEQHRTAEQFNWRNSQVLNVLIAIAAFVAAVFAAGSFVQTRRQANISQLALTEGGRAWINVDIDAATVSLTWIKNAPHIAGRITGINEGNSPALNVQLFGYVFVPVSATTRDDRVRIEGICQGDPYSGNILFMKEQSVSDKFGSDITAIDFTVEADTPEKERLVKNAGIPVPLGIVVCGVYKVVGDPELHHIARVYDVGRQPDTGGGLSAVMLNENIPAHGIRLKREVDGEYAD